MSHVLNLCFVQINQFLLYFNICFLSLNTSATMPSELETAMESLIKVFHRYASKDGKAGTLNRRELRELMENELSNFLKVRKNH